MYTFEIPEWAFYWAIVTVGVLVFFGILFRFVSKYVNAQQAKAKRRIQELIQAVEEQKQDEERRLKELLPGPWRTLKELFQGQSRATKQSVLLTFESFERDVKDIPEISPWGFDFILESSYYNIGENGNCHEEAYAILGKYVKLKFPNKTPEEG